MIERIVEISEPGIYVRVKDAQLVLERGKEQVWSAPVEEVAAVVVSNPDTILTHRALASLAAAGASVVVSDEKHLPVGMMVPLAGHSVQGERFRLQAEAGLPVKKRLWQELMKGKLRAQAKLLMDLYGKDFGLENMASKVRSGDPDNLEAQAAGRYWPELFGDPKFRRDREAEDQNRFLNYGYTVLRALTARAICGAGLHPSLGVHHHNRYDSFCLADDLMEPFRPVVDRAVVGVVSERGGEAPMDKDIKAMLLEPLLGKFGHEGGQRTLFDSLARLSVAVANAFSGKGGKLPIPMIAALTAEHQEKVSADGETDNEIDI